MFKVADNYKLQHQVTEAEKNYVIQKNDLLKLTVHTNNGERVIDPNNELMKNMPMATNMAEREVSYLVDLKGIAKFPMIGEFKVEGLTIRQAEEILQKEFTKYYQTPFIVLSYLNKRVVVLGEPGGQVIPLINENVRLTEVLALSKAVQHNANAHNIRILRGEQVFVADLSTIDGYLKNNIIIEPGDIVYVEPIRRPVIEAMRDYSPFISILTSIGAIIIVISK